MLYTITFEKVITPNKMQIVTVDFHTTEKDVEVEFLNKNGNCAAVLNVEEKEMKKFYFNTGVKIWNNPHIKGGIDSGNGTVVIPFECDVPEGVSFMFACNKSNLYPNDPNILVAEIHNTALLSKYAYFSINQ